MLPTSMFKDLNTFFTLSPIGARGRRVGVGTVGHRGHMSLLFCKVVPEAFVTCRAPLNIYARYFATVSYVLGCLTEGL